MLLTSKSDVLLGIKAAGLRHCVVINVAVICVGEAVPLSPSSRFSYCIGTKDSRARKQSRREYLVKRRVDKLEELRDDIADEEFLYSDIK